MTICMTARFSIRPESAEVCEQAIREFIRYIEENEPDTRFYASWAQSDDMTEFLHVFSFKDEAARQKHRTSAGVKHFTDVLYPQLASDGVEFQEYGLLASTGL